MLLIYKSSKLYDAPDFCDDGESGYNHNDGDIHDDCACNVHAHDNEHDA